MESIVILKCRQKDVGLVKVAAQDARSIYEKKIKTQVNIIIDETSGYLPDSGCGGVILSVMDGRIKLVNTLENRLELLGEKVCISILMIHSTITQ